MFSFQPAAYVGNPKRGRDDFHAADIDTVWREVERGAGIRLPWRHLQMGDERCNRTAYGVLAAGRWAPLLDDRDPRDLRARDRFFDIFGGMDFDRPPAITAIAVARVVARHPGVVAQALGWAAQLARRAGPLALLRCRPRGLTLDVSRLHGRRCRVRDPPPRTRRSCRASSGQTSPARFPAGSR